MVAFLKEKRAKKNIPNFNEKNFFLKNQKLFKVMNSFFNPTDKVSASHCMKKERVF